MALDEQSTQHLAQERHRQWRQQLPSDMRQLRLKDLYLTLELQDFGQDDTRSYLLKLGEQRQTNLFADDLSLVQAIGQLTHGHPLYLILAAAAALEAKAHGQKLVPEDFELARVSPDIVPEHEDERIGDYLFHLLLQQLLEDERKDLIFCAVPRFLKEAMLRVILPQSDDIERRKRWNDYQLFTFMKPIEPGTMAFHPVVRSLLLRQLPVHREPESDYSQIHTRLRNYFHSVGNKQKPYQELETGQAKIEEAYHSLALGNPEVAIALGIVAQQENLLLWQPLQEVAAQAPIELCPDDVEEQAYNAAVRAQQHHDVKDRVRAIVLYHWILKASKRSSSTWAMTQNNLGTAYGNLPGGDREQNLKQAIACYEAALQVFQFLHVDYYVRIVKENLERARDELQNME